MTEVPSFGCVVPRHPPLIRAVRRGSSPRVRQVEREEQHDTWGVLVGGSEKSWAKAKVVGRAMGQNWSSFTVPAEGISRGLIMMWKTAFEYVDVVAVSRYAAHMVVSSREGETWLMTMVYAKEKRSYARVTLGLKSSTFAKFVEEAGVCDLGYEGVLFTWCNNQLGDNQVWVRLDIALANTDWVRKYPRSRVVHLDRSTSDHAPLLVLVQSEPDSRRRPFRFELYWTEYQECRNIIARRHLRSWSKTGLGRLESEMDLVRMEIKRLEERDAGEALDDAGLTNPRCCYNRKVALSRQINLKWLQRSRLKWVQEGDRNTHFFHLMATLRGRRNKIQRLVSKEGEWILDQEQIVKELLDHYEEL
ncbi:uncharacterized protein [Typha angustifolia]|uniref:uncharacterized protein n=1 Tax=Typha angustifolia TaxID=59011 RepID=UPI003C308E6B